MPRLLLFVAREKVITDLNNSVSLMNLLQDITFQIPAGITPPANAGSPMQWAVISVFERDNSDQGKVFEHYMALMSSSNDILIQSPISLFELKTEQHRITNQINGMPIARPGTHHMRCYIREKGTMTWQECAHYPVKIVWSSSLIAIPN